MNVSCVNPWAVFVGRGGGAGIGIPGCINYNAPVINMALYNVLIWINNNKECADGTGDSRMIFSNVLEIDHMAALPTELISRDEDIDVAARSLKAMSHPLRLKILCTLGDQEVSVQDIVDSVGTSQSNISQHLAILRDKGILSSRKDANRVYYRIADPRTLRLICMMRELFCTA